METVPQPIEIAPVDDPMAEDDEETTNDIHEMLNLYRKYEEIDEAEYRSDYDHDRSVEVNLANLEFPIGIASASHQTETSNADTDEIASIKASGLAHPRDPQWNCYWDRSLLLQNRGGKGLRQLTELTLKRYEGVTEKLFDKFGTVTLTSGIIYQGPFNIQRKPTGVGRVIFPDGTIFDGEIKDGEIGRRGIYRWTDGSIYEGNIRKGMRHGYGRFFDASSRSFYCGNWHCGHMHDYGKTIYYGTEVDFYQGSWHAGIQWGRGIRQWASGNFYEGQWACGLPHGNGCKFWLSHHVYYRGEFEEGGPHGYGLMVWLVRQVPAFSARSQKYFYGTFNHGLLEGAGTFVDMDGSTYDGHWAAGKKHGKFTVKAANGITVNCFFVNDTVHDPLQQFLLKESKEQFYLVPLPGPSIRQIDYHPYYDPEVSAIAMPGTVFLLSEKFGFPEEDIAEEIRGISTILTSYLEPLMDVYNVYNRLMVETSCDNYYTLRAFQFWQFLVDVVLEKGNSGTDIQQGLYYVITAIESCFDGDKKLDIFNHPYRPIKVSEFFDRITVAAYLIELRKQNAAVWRDLEMKNMAYQDTKPSLWPFTKTWDISGRPIKHLIESRLFEYAGRFNSCLCDDPRKCPIVFRYISQFYRMYRYIYELYGGQEEAMPEALSMDTVIKSLKDAHIVGLPGVSYVQLLKLVESDFPEIRDGGISFTLEFPITLLEFTEIIFKIALAYQGDLSSLEKVKPFHGRKPWNFKGRITEAVDSVVLTGQKKPELLTNKTTDTPDYDPDFFAMLRGDDTIGPKMSSGDATVDLDGPEVLIRHSRPTLGTNSRGSVNTNGPYYEGADLFGLTVHPPTDPTDYEFPDCSLSQGASFLGFTLTNPKSTTAPVSSRTPGCAENPNWTKGQPPTSEPPRSSSQSVLPDMPSLEAYAATGSECTVTPLLPAPTLTSWNTQVVPFLEQVFFPKMILFKRTNDLLIQHGHLRPLGDREDPESGLADCLVDALIDGDPLHAQDGL